MRLRLETETMAENKEILAFAFSMRGSKPATPEVKELGVKSDTLSRYFRQWKNETIEGKSARTGGKSYYD